MIDWPWHEHALAPVDGAPPELGQAVTEYRQYLERAAMSRLQTTASSVAPDGPAPAVLLRFGKPYVELLDVAREQRADLILLGVRGRSSLDLGFFGSTANHVVRTATCPVLTVPV